MGGVTKKDVVLGAAGGYTWDQISPWALSLIKSGYQGLGAVILYNENVEVRDRLKSLGFQILAMPLRGSVYNQRFLDFNEVLGAAAHSLRYAVVTDVRDIYFQSDPVRWIEQNLHADKQFLAVSEGIRFRDDPWNVANLNGAYPDLASDIMDKCVRNVGVLAGRASAISDICLAIGQMAKSSNFSIADQSGFNILINRYPYSDRVQLCESEDGFVCQVGTFANPSMKFDGCLLEPPPVFDGQDMRTAGGKPYAIVHQYDRHPELEKALLRKLHHS